MAWKFTGTAVPMLLLLGACATTPEQWMGPPGAPMALADCRAKSDALPITQNVSSQPFTVAAMQQSYINDCMAAKGYQLR